MPISHFLQSGTSYRRVMLTLMSSAVQLYQTVKYVCVHMKDRARDLTQTKYSASQALFSAANPRCCINSAINAKVSSHRLLCGDAG